MVVVVAKDAKGEDRTDQIATGAHWLIHDGHLNVVDGGGNPVASYAPGAWSSVFHRAG